MSQKNNEKENFKVSKIIIEKRDIPDVIDTKEYHEFLDRYNTFSISKYSIDILMMIYDNGIQLLNQYYIQCNNRQCDINLITKFQFVLGAVNHAINVEHHNELQKRIEETKKLNSDMRSAKSQMRNIQKILKEITTTIISIILAVSIIPTAVAGIQNIDGRYILPFISSISLIGMSSILYIYLIHNVKINKAAIIVYIVSLAVTIALWLLAWEIKIECIPKNIESYETSIKQQDTTSGDIKLQIHID